MDFLSPKKTVLLFKGAIDVKRSSDWKWFIRKNRINAYLVKDSIGELSSLSMICVQKLLS